MDKSIVSIKTPDEATPSKFTLLLSRGGMMGGASNVFFVDELTSAYDAEGRPHTVRGMIGEKTIVEFPFGSPYILVARELVEFMTPLDAATKQKAEEAELEVVLNPGGNVPVLPEFIPGGYR